MSLLVKGRPQGCEIVKVTPASAGWKHVGFEAFRLAPNENLRLILPADREGFAGCRLRATRHAVRDHRA